MLKKLDFVTPTVLRVMYVFHGDPMRELHEREVVRRARVSEGSANSILRRLSEEGVLERRRVGRMVFYRLNDGSAVARQFKVLFNVYSLQGLVDRVKAHSRRIVLFGSCAEGLDVKGSDVDLLILTQEKREVLEEVSAYQKGLDRRLSPIVVSANEFARLKREDKPLHERIERGIVLWESE